MLWALVPLIWGVAQQGEAAPDERSALDPLSVLPNPQPQQLHPSSHQASPHATAGLPHQSQPHRRAVATDPAPLSAVLLQQDAPDAAAPASLASPAAATAAKEPEPAQKDDWEHYQLADTVKGRRDLQTTSCNRFPGSIACEYSRLVQQPHHRSNISVVTEVVRGRSAHQQDLPASDVTVMHLRLGDVMQSESDCWESVCTQKVSSKNSSVWKDGQWEKQYVYTGAQWEEAFGKMNLNQKVRIFASSQHAGHTNSESRHDASAAYVQKLVELLHKKGKEVLASGHTESPDKDFVHMCNAHQFIPSGGGFSRLVSKVVEAMGHEVLLASFVREQWPRVQTTDGDDTEPA